MTCECKKPLCQGKCKGEVKKPIYGLYLCENCFDDCLTPEEQDEAIQSHREED